MREKAMLESKNSNSTRAYVDWVIQYILKLRKAVKMAEAYQGNKRGGIQKGNSGQQGGGPGTGGEPQQS